MKNILEFEELTKRFPGVVALDRVSFQVKEKEILGLVGENGAGKSTLLKILAGVYRDYEGILKLNGQTVRFNHPKEAMDAGISVIYQELNFFDELTVAENIFMGKWPIKKGCVNHTLMNSRAKEALRELQVDIDPKSIMRTLSVAQKQVVEIVKALTNESKILVMDEPTSALSEAEAKSLIRSVKGIRDKKGISIIYVSHKLDEIDELCDRVQVIRDGKTISSYPAKEVQREILIRDMVGRELKDIYPQIQTKPKEVIFEAQKVNGRYVHNISFHVRAGEILGIYGLMGSGTVELADTLFGVRKMHSGSIKVNGKPLKGSSPIHSVKSGVAYLTSDRKSNGLILGQSIQENMATACLKRMSGKLGILDFRKEEENAKHWQEKMHIKTPSVQQIAGNLSGGNQQKVVIGKWLSTDCKVLIFCDPTRGIDVNAKYEIYKILKELCLEGYAVIIISHEIPEIMGISDRIHIMRDGKLVAELDSTELHQDQILEHAIGKEQQNDKEQKI